MNNDFQPVNIVASTDVAIANQGAGATTSIIDYHSAGYCLIIGDTERAIEIASRLNCAGVTIVTVNAHSTQLQKQLTDDGIAVFSTSSLTLTGYLGAFIAIADDRGDAIELAVSVYRESGAFDLVLDLSTEPFFDQLLPPFGYYHAKDEHSLKAAIDEIPTLLGEFEKPKYFDYNASICAHSRSELNGCSNCIDVCTTKAIQADGEGVKVNPYLCQGCGTCATVCPSGAMNYAYPRPSNAIDKTRGLISDADSHTLLMHSESQQEAIDALAQQAGLLPLLVEEVSAFGMDYWASMVCAGIQKIILVQDSDDASPNVTAVQEQISLFEQLMSGLGINEPIVHMVKSHNIESMLAQLEVDSMLAKLTPASFATHNDKRQTLRTAFDTLGNQLKPIKEQQSLPASAPFGAIEVDKEKCTLCMACVSTCPAKALLDGQDTPALRMIEANCLQCGLCEKACPEAAITLTPRYTYNSIEARKIQTLNEDAPFDCIRCQKPFATARIISTMFSKLEGHWMFGDDKARRRLKMCEDCRVRDIFEEDAKGIDVHKDEETTRT